jgi:7-cyano-7-deazaguanine synthase
MKRPWVWLSKKTRRTSTGMSTRSNLELDTDLRRKAVVLLSGGLDSATALAEAKASGFALHALTIHYGQRHAIEGDAARRIAGALGVVRHVEQVIDLRVFGGSALTDEIDVPKDRDNQTIASSIPITYVPARNTVFVDYSGYPDCRPEYLSAFEAMANLATKAGVEGLGHFRIHAPLLKLTKEEIILRGRALGVPFALTHSCYDPSPEGLACGRCDSCTIRRAAFARLGLTDPAAYMPAGKSGSRP